MDKYGCDYECRTVGESITKYNIPDDWGAEFDAYDDVYPIIRIRVDKIRKAPAMMDLKLRIIENPADDRSTKTYPPHGKHVILSAASEASVVEGSTH